MLSLKEPFKISDAWNGAVSSRLEQFHLRADVFQLVIERRCGNENDFFIPADFMQGLVTARQFITEPMRLVHHDIGVFVHAPFKNPVERAEGLHIKAGHVKLMQRFTPVIHKHGRADDQLSAGGQFLQQQRGNKGLAQTHHVRQKYAVIACQDLPR